MLQETQKIKEWNEIAGNINFNRNLEASMMSEEFAEFIIALKNNDKIEAVDGLLDMFIIGVGTLNKMGVDVSKLKDCFDEIMRSNFSKFIENEDGSFRVLRQDGKVIKPTTYSKPNLKEILER